MWTDKQLYWASTEKGDGPAPSKKEVVYTDIIYPSISMKIAVGWYAGGLYHTYEEGVKEAQWHRERGAILSCIKQCKLSPCKTYCLGCLRTIEQIKEAGSKAKKQG